MGEGVENANTLITQEAFFFEKAKDFVAKNLLGSFGIDVRHRKPLTFLIPDTSRGEAMDMGMHVDQTAKGLLYGNHTRTEGFVITGGLIMSR